LGGESLSQDQIDALFRSLAAGDNNKTPDPKPESDDDNESSDENK